jgi:hypothetical protein
MMRCVELRSQNKSVDLTLQEEKLTPKKTTLLKN